MPGRPDRTRVRVGGSPPQAARWGLAFGVLLAAVLVGCGGGSAPASTSGGGSPVAQVTETPTAATSRPGPQGTVDACALLTADEVAAKAGDKVSKTEKSDNGCTWWLGDDATSWIKLVVWPSGGAMFDAIAADGTAVAGLGDKASLNGASLEALKGDTMLQLGSEIVLSPADPAKFNRPLMELALSRL